MKIFLAMRFWPADEVADLRSAKAFKSKELAENYANSQYSDEFQVFKVVEFNS